MPQWINVAADDDVIESEVLGVSAAGTPVALFRLGGQVFAMHDSCSHGHARLSDGFVEDGNVECPLHQGLICIRTGEPKSAPITEAIATFETRLTDGRVEVLV